MLANFYAWISAGANSFGPKNFGLTGDKYEFRAHRTYQYKYNWESLETEYRDLVEEATAITVDGIDYTFALSAVVGTSSWTPENFTMQFIVNSSEGSGAMNLDYQIFCGKDYSSSIFFLFKHLCIFQYKKTTDVNWSDCPNIKDLLAWQISENEFHSTPIVPDSETAEATNIKYFFLYQMPSTLGYSHYKITGIEWMNGSLVAGNIQCGVLLIDAIPPVGYSNPHICMAAITAQGDANQIQRCSLISPNIIPAGQEIGVYLQNDSAGGRLKYLNAEGNSNYHKTTAYAVQPAFVSNTAWNAPNNIKIYCKIYYIGIK